MLSTSCVVLPEKAALTEKRGRIWTWQESSLNTRPQESIIWRHASSMGQWEWKAMAIKRKLPEFTGTASSLEGAKKSAMACIGLMDTAWTDVGPAIEVQD